MNRLWMLVLVLCSFVVALVAQAPAALLDLGVRQASDGLLRIADARGSVWGGDGVVLADTGNTSNADITHGALPLGNLAWNFAGFKEGALEIGLAFDNRPLGVIRVDIGGVGSNLADWRLPAAETLSLLPGALGRAEWDGQLALKTGTVRCDWLGRCAGRAQLAWSGAATRRIENGSLGEFFLALDGRDEHLDFALSSGDGPIALTGKGQLLSTSLKFNGFARGDDAVLSQFPGFLGKVFEATDKPGEYRITVDSPLVMQ